MEWPASIQSVDEAFLRSAHGAPSWAVPLFFVLTTVGAGWGMVTFIPFLIRKQTRRITLYLILALSMTSALTTTLKALFGRPRPCEALGWCEAIAVRSPGGYSFPSGHASGAFAFASFIAVVAPRWAVPAFVFAFGSAWSRCALGVHYPSDVLAGALLGTLMGTSVAKLALARSKAKAASKANGKVRAIERAAAAE